MTATGRAIFCKPLPPLKKRIVKRRYSDLSTPKQVYKLLTFNYIILKTKTTKWRKQLLFLNLY